MARPLYGLLLLVLALGVGACRRPTSPISVENGTITIENRTAQEWRNVRVLVNHHFGGGGASSLPAGGRMHAPVNQLQTGHGQKFDRARQSIFRVEVTATTADGQPVKLVWPDEAETDEK